MTVYTVILAGGWGTRFWPLSRAARPKQFLPLASDRPLIVDTIRRVSRISTLSQTYVSCGPTHAPAVRKLIKRLPASNVLVEPLARNTAPAIGLAAAHIAARDPGAVMQVLPADHAIREEKKFLACLLAAGRLAQRGFLVTLGIRPSRPETGYGYIQLGEPIDSNGARVKAFVEKPDPPTARRYLEAGQFLWNSGIFIFRTDAILDAFAQHMPQLSQGLARISGAIGKSSYRSTVAREFRKLPKQSIDYGVMEKAHNIAVVPGNFGWSDLGSFASLGEVRSADGRGNVVSGKTTVLVNCDNCVVFADHRPVALSGLCDMVVIDTGDVLLVVPKQESQQVRSVVETFRSRGLKRFL